MSIIVKLIIFLYALSILVSCVSNINKFPTKPKSKSDINYEIINQTLKELIPSKFIDNKSSSQTIFINDEQYYLDSSSIDKIISCGGSNLLENMKSACFSTDLYLHKLTGFDNVKVAQTYPLTTNEFKQTIGCITYSRICFNKDQNRAAFVYEYLLCGKHTTIEFCAVEATLIKEKWEISSKVKIPKEDKPFWYR